MISSRRLRRARQAVGVAVAVTALGLLAGCGSDSGSSGGSGEAKLLKIGTANTVDSLNPFVGVSILSTEFMHQMYPYLTQYGTDATVKPAYAESWRASDDFRTLTMTLASGGRWSDGTPLTAKDAAFTLNTLVRYSRGAATYLYGAVPTLQEASAPDDTTLVIRFNASSPQAPSQLTYLPILPEHVWTRYATGKGKGLGTFQNNAPVVSGGPFTLQAYQDKQFAKFVRNPGFYGSKPHVQQLGYSIYSSPDALVKAISSGEVDAAEMAPPSSLPALRSANLTIQNPVSFSELWFMINDANGTPTHPELHNADVRRALDMAIDRDRIVTTAYYGQAEPGSSIVPPANGDYHLDSPVTAFDIDGANALLDQAGFRRGSDGIRQANGHPMEYRLIEFRTTGGAEDPAAQILKSDFAKLGIKMNISVLDVSAAIAALQEKDYTAFDLSIVTFAGGYDPTNVLNSLTCNALATFNPNGHCDRAFDDKFSQMIGKPDGAERTDLVHQMQQDMLDNGSLPVLAYSKDVYAYRPGWTGFVVTPNGWFYGTATATSVRKDG